MRELKRGEFEKAPKDVQWVYIRAQLNIPMGMADYEEMLQKYPEYFPDEIEHRRKWASVPQEVKDLYYKESEEVRAQVYKDLPRSNGIIYWIGHPQEFAEWRELQDECNNRYRPLEIGLFNKYFGQYGLTKDPATGEFL